MISKEKGFYAIIIGMIIIGIFSLACKNRQAQNHLAQNREEAGAELIQEIRQWESEYGIKYKNFVPEYDLSKYPPKVLIFSAMDTMYLRNTASEWKQRGIDGFILNYLGYWWHGEEYLESRKAEAAETIEACKKAGITDNFYLIYTTNKDLPRWNDSDEKWDQFYRVFKKAVEVARDAGFKGVALDTEPYSVRVWEPNSEVNKDIPEDQLPQLIRERSRKMGEIIAETFPDSVILIMPEGAMYYHIKNMGSCPEAYELWEHFYSGILDAKPPGKIIVCLERTYNVTPLNLAEQHLRRSNDFFAGIGDPDYVKEHVSIAPGAYPLGKAYDDKGAMYSFRNFEEQIRSFEKFAPEYVWIYANGAAWWQVCPEEREQCTANKRWIWQADYQSLPCDPNIDEFYRVLSPERKAVLKEYYESLRL